MSAPVSPVGVERKLIALMGPTGSGKSTFTNAVCDQQFAEVGHGLGSCTTAVQPIPFKFAGEQVTLVDTPGFDDTVRPQADVLKEIATFLEKTYERGKRFTAVIYMHRITDRRMTGISMETFRLFRKICGDDAMKNVTIVTNMWEEVDEKVGQKREEEIKSNFFKDAFDHGAKMCRHYGTPDSAKDIVRQTLQLDPRVLRVQDEMVKEKKSVPDTDAGIQLLKELDAETERRQKEIIDLRSELDALGGAHDDEVAQVKASIVDLEEMLEKIKTERYNLSVAVTEAIIARSTFNASKAIGPDDAQPSFPGSGGKESPTPSPRETTDASPSHPKPTPKKSWFKRVLGRVRHKKSMD